MADNVIHYTHAPDVAEILAHARENVKAIDQAGMYADPRVHACFIALEVHWASAFHFKSGAAGLVLHLDAAGADKALVAFASLSALAREARAKLTGATGGV